MMPPSSSPQPPKIGLNMRLNNRDDDFENIDSHYKQEKGKDESLNIRFSNESLQQRKGENSNLELFSSKEVHEGGVSSSASNNLNVNRESRNSSDTKSSVERKSIQNRIATIHSKEKRKMTSKESSLNQGKELLDQLNELRQELELYSVENEILMDNLIMASGLSLTSNRY